MKEKILKKGIIILILVVQILQLVGNFMSVEASIKAGDIIHLQSDHKCDSLLEYWIEDYQEWSYEVVKYVYYIDKDDGNKYPAFCIEPSKKGEETSYISYDAEISREKDSRIWRILNKGYMGSNYKEWNLECDDDFYTATKVALHSLSGKVAPKDKYILGNKSIDGNTVEEIQRRGAKVLDVAQTLYEYGINGIETYQVQQINISRKGDNEIENIQNVDYCVQNYEVKGNKNLKSYEIEIQNFPTGTKILNSKNQKQSKLSENSFKIAIPVDKINEDIKGKIQIKDAYIKTNLVFHCMSYSKETQNYVTYTSGYEIANTSTTLEIKANSCNLQIQKVDSETKKPIANVTFEIKDEKGNILGEVTTNQIGIASLTNLYPQNIIIKETKVPEPYVLSTEEKQVKLEWQKTSTVTFENERKKGNLKILKVDVDDNELALENVEFELLDSNGKVVKTLITNEKGEAYANNLEIGTYTLRETKTKQGYYLATDKKVEIKYKETTEIQIENEKIKGQIEILKISKDDNLINGDKKGTPIENVEFEIRKENGEFIEKITTNKEGIALSSKLEKGTYIIKETKSHQDYKTTNEEFKIQIMEHEKIEKITITNAPKDPEIPKLPRTGF